MSLHIQVEELIDSSTAIEPRLAQRLREIKKWIKNRQEGFLRSKPYVVHLIQNQIVPDTKTWVNLKLAEKEGFPIELAPLLPTERYWYGVLFFNWFSSRDEKFRIWKRQLMSGQFSQRDESPIQETVKQIKKVPGADVLRPHRLIADLSMATDLIVSYKTANPLCVQITCSAQSYTAEKYSKWENTLRYWNIDRGLFVNYNPASNVNKQRLVNQLLRYSDQISSGTYKQLNIA